MMTLVYSRIAVLLIAISLDLIIGDPQNPLHPIRLIGSLIALGTRIYRKAQVKKPMAQYLWGMTLTAFLITSVFALVYLITLVLYNLNLLAGIIGEAIICYFLIATKSLKVESMKVHDALLADDLVLARANLAMIVGRDTDQLDQASVTKAAVETIAENLSDGVIAPLIYMTIGGAPLGMAYKVVNTLDSMIGYKTEEFLFFGRFAAQFDDLLNLLPARFSALMLIIASALLRTDTSAAIRIFRRDRLNHASPNSAQTESVVAGALGLQLGGDTSYHGQMVSKPTIGDDSNPARIEHIVIANRLMYMATFCSLLLIVACALLTGATFSLFFPTWLPTI